MNNGNRGRPLTKRQTIRLLIALTILAWATQTLLSQWGFGAEAPATAPSEWSNAPPERFVPGSPRFDAGATVELRSEATVVGEEVKLRQVCRWSERDEVVLGPIGDLVLARLGQGTPFRSVSLDEIKALLHDAGVNIAALNFVGAMACTVNRSDIQYDERDALQKWIAAKENATQSAKASSPVTEPSTQSGLVSASDERAVDAADDSPVRSLRTLLVADLAQRLSIPVESIQITFRPQDEKVLALAEPLFKFQIEPARLRNLGDVSWSVLIISEGSSQKAAIHATARAWQTQVVLAKPLLVKQVIREEDLIERRTLVDHLDEDPPVTRTEVVGQQAARDLSAGVVVTARMVDPVQLVRAGQYVTISLSQGNVQVKTVARALESGSYGQTIRVKNEVTRDVFQVIMTGPQTATMNLTAGSAARPDSIHSANARE